jgi:hypothetical protein
MGSPPRHDIAFGNVRMEVDFLALDDEDDIAKLRSADYTGGMFHEAQYIDLPVFREGRSRTNRFPEESDGGATWHGIIADANAPDEDHWLAQMTGQVDLPEGLTVEERRAAVAEHLGLLPAGTGRRENPQPARRIHPARGQPGCREPSVAGVGLLSRLAGRQYRRLGS